MSNGRRVLITGASGWTGSHLCSLALANGTSVILAPSSRIVVTGKDAGAIGVHIKTQISHLKQHAIPCPATIHVFNCHPVDTWNSLNKGVE